jgi:hypothetical protein
VFTTVEQVFHGFNFFTPVAEGIKSSSGLESFVLCPDGSIQYLKDGFFGFRGKE